MISRSPCPASRHARCRAYVPIATGSLTRNATFSEIENARAAMSAYASLNGGFVMHQSTGRPNSQVRKSRPSRISHQSRFSGFKGIVKGTATAAGINAKAFRIKVIDNSTGQSRRRKHEVIFTLAGRIATLIDGSHTTAASNPNGDLRGWNIGFDPFVQHRRPN